MRSLIIFHESKNVKNVPYSRPYLDTLASIKVECPLGELVASVCRPTSCNGRPVRALRPWSKDDTNLLKAISRGQFNINGFRNRDIRNILFPGNHDASIRRRLPARVTHRLRILRAHGIIKKVQHTHRYVLTKRMRQIATAIIHTQCIPVSKLTELAA
jgi:hypothetical protein